MSSGNNNLILCTVCNYYFPNYKIRHHRKLCITLFKLTGKRNNSQTLSTLSTIQQSKIIQYFNSTNIRPSTTSKPPPPAASTTTMVPYNTNVSKYRYNSLHSARRPNTNKEVVPVIKTYNDIFFQNKVMAYNKSRGIPPPSQPPMPKQNDIVIIRPNRPNPQSPTKRIDEPKVRTTEMVPYRSPGLSMIPLSTNYHHLVNGKNIALVGPSKSVLKRNLGNYIDTFDLVVRLNKSLPVPENRYQDIGSRTDILYNSLNTTDFPGENNINPKFFIHNGIKYVCCSYPNIHPFQKDIINFMTVNRGQVPFRYIDLELFQKMEAIMKTRPYTGTCAILDLLKFNIKSLFITGLDFYATSYYSEYRVIDSEETKKKQKNNIHEAKPQINLLRILALTDSRIILDKVLDTILFHQYRTFVKQLGQQKFKTIFTPLKHSSTKRINTLMNPNTDSKPALYFFNDSISQIPKDAGLIITNINHPHVDSANIVINTQKVTPPKELTAEAVINIHPIKKQSEEIGSYEMVNFNSEYNNYMNRALTKLGIDGCSINFYVILFLSMFMDKYTVHIIGFDNMLNKREENLFYRFLLRNGNIVSN